MLRIRTEVRPSTIPGAGLGVFCIEATPGGALIWVFDRGLDVRLDTLPDDPVMLDFMSRYAYLQADGASGHVVCLDNARFMNHAEASAATCRVEADGTTYAARDLAPGTELTCPYTAFCADDPAFGYKMGEEEAAWARR